MACRGFFPLWRLAHIVWRMESLESAGRYLGGFFLGVLQLYVLTGEIFCISSKHTKLQKFQTFIPCVFSVPRILFLTFKVPPYTVTCISHPHLPPANITQQTQRLSHQQSRTSPLHHSTPNISQKPSSPPPRTSAHQPEGFQAAQARPIPTSAYSSLK